MFEKVADHLLDEVRTINYKVKVKDNKFKAAPSQTKLLNKLNDPLKLLSLIKDESSDESVGSDYNANEDELERQFKLFDTMEMGIINYPNLKSVIALLGEDKCS